MSKLSLKLQKILSEKIGYQCKVWFEQGYHGGWMWTTDKTYQQRLGFNFKQAENHILNSKWDWLKEYLSSI